MTKVNKKLLETFLAEANEHLQTISDCLLALEKVTASPYAMIELIHRETHSLKGDARAVDIIDIELIAQSMETVFLGWKKQQFSPAVEHFDILHDAVKIMKSSLSEENLNNKIEPTILNDIIKRIRQINTSTDSEPKINKPNETIKPSAHEGILDYQSVRIDSNKLDTILLQTEELQTLKLFSQQNEDELMQVYSMVTALKNQPDTTLQYNKMIHAIENSLNLFILHYKKNRNRLSNMLDNLLHDSKKLIMFPLTILFNGLSVMARNISREQGKEINFIVEGAHIEIDKRILDTLKDPLVHLIRNSIDHGIEDAATRESLQKSKQGNIKITISQKNSNLIEIIIVDDGGGINIEFLKSAAIKQDIITADAAELMSEQDILNLIFKSGFSTNSVITNISGQGLGMTIVKEKIEQLEGTITVSSQKKRGTKIVLTVPLTLATFKGVVIKEEDQFYIFPTAHLERIIRVKINDIKTIENREIIKYENTTIPFIKLCRILNIPAKESTHQKAFYSVIIIHFEEDRFAFLVDEIQGENEIIIKKLNNPLNRVKFISGASLLWDGIPVPILSTNDLIKAFRKGNFYKLNTDEESKEKSETKKPILLAEDSITTRMLLKNILQTAGYAVITAVDGFDAWQTLKQNEVSLVISDVEMPRLDGFKLTAKIRNEDKFSHLPVILVTGRESKADREHGIDVGANAYIVKSRFNDNNLISTIERLI